MAFTDYLDEKLGEGKEVSGERLYACPFCADTNKLKFSVHTDSDNKRDLWQCWRCGSKGNPIKFAMKYNKVGFQEAKDILEMYVDVDPIDQKYREEGLTDKEILHLKLIELNSPKKEEAKYPVPPRLPTGFKLLMENINNPEAYPYFEYLIKERKLNFDDIEKHNIGYIVSGYAMTSTGNKVDLSEHVIFFTYSNAGEYLYWNTRSIRSNPYLKSINAIPLEGELGKGDVVFNLNRAKYHDKVVILEGVIDALTIGDCGIATFGKQISDRQIELILNNVEKEATIYVMLDRDAPKQAIEVSERLVRDHKKTFIVMNPTYEDPNQLGKEKSWDIINNYSIHASSDKKAFLYL